MSIDATACRRPLFSLALFATMIFLPGCSLTLQSRPDPFITAVLEIEPNHPTAQFALALAAMQAGQYEKAIPSLKAVLLEYPTHRNALNRIGQCHLELHQYSEAIPYFNRSLELGENWPARAGHVSALMMLGDIEPMNTSLQKLEVYGPAHVVNRLRGDAAFLARENQFARDYYLKSLNQHPDQPELRERLTLLQEYLTLTP